MACGKQIKTLEGLRRAALDRKSVVVPRCAYGRFGMPWGKPKPAAFMINLSGHMLVHLFNTGMYIYKKEE